MYIILIHPINRKSGKTVDHLLVHFEVARALRDDIFRSIRLAWVMPGRVTDLLASRKSLHGIPQIGG